MERRASTWLALATLACAAPPPNPPPAPPPPPAASWFVEVSAEAGLDFRHETGATGDLHLPEIMGSGAALLDLDGDGDLDAYLVNAAFALGEGTAADGSRPVNRLYVQQTDGRFADATENSGLGDPGYGMGVAAGDVDNDGRVDLYVANLGRDRLYRSTGKGGDVRFEDITAAAGVDVGGWSSSVSFLDYDRDGFLDIYVARYVEYDPTRRCYDFAGRHEYCGPTAYPGHSDVLLRNRGPGADGRITFEDVSRAAGIAAISDAGLGVVAEDFDGDGRTDVYVANDADPNQLWIQQADGSFRDDALILGASVNAMGSAEAGMGVLAADFDGDLGLDLFMTHLEDESNTLYRNLGGGLGFEDVTARSGLDTTSTPYTGFGTAAFDAELDGDLDLLVANGRVLRSKLLPGELGAPWSHYAEPNLFYLGDGGGRFEAAGDLAGGLAARVEITRGVAVGDVDGDGDLDVLVSNTQGPARLYRNQAPRRGHWLVVDAYDPRLRRTALGARLVAHTGGRAFLRSVNSGFSYQSASDPRAHFGLGEADRVERLEVRWPDGLREQFGPIAADQALRVVRGEGRAM